MSLSVSNFHVALIALPKKNVTFYLIHNPWYSISLLFFAYIHLRGILALDIKSHFFFP